MKLYIAITTLTSLAIAAPAGAVVEPAALEARQTFSGCSGAKPGEYHCWITLADPNDRYSYIGQCGTDGNTHVSDN